MRHFVFLLAIFLTIFLAMADGLQADSFAYEATGGDNFGLLNLDTGAFNLIGNMGQLLSGLGVAGGTIYGGVFGGSTLYSVNPATGGLSPVGVSGITYAGMGSTTGGLFALDPTGKLWSVNPVNGQTTSIGSTGLTLSGIWGVSTNSSALYITLNSNFYSVNTTTGLATLIGNTGRSFGALVSTGGTLYAGANPANQVYKLDPATAAATFVSNETGTGIGGSFWGLAPAAAPVAAVPEPSSLSLLLLGVLSLAVISRRQNRNS